MRRKDREISDIAEIRGILDLCKTCHLAMVDDGHPYVIPLSYGYELKDGVLVLYFHSAAEGKKLDILRKNGEVCFEMSAEGEPVYSPEHPCNSGCYFSSLHGFGNAEFIGNANEKCRALTLLMKHQTKADVEFTDTQAAKVCVFKVVAANFTGKRMLPPKQ